MSNLDFYELKEAKTILLLKAPFFATLMYNMMKLVMADENGEVEVDGIKGGMPTLGTDGRHIFINKEYFLKLSTMERVFALGHEISHAMFLHMKRGKEFEEKGFDGNKFIPFLYNIAGDYVINDMLKKGGCGTYKEGWLWDDKYDNTMNVDDVYRDLYNQLTPQQKQAAMEASNGTGDNGEEGDGSGGGVPKELAEKYGVPQDSHMYSSNTRTKLEWKQAVQASYQAAKAQGKLPGALERLVNDLTTPEVSWKEQLRTSLVNTAGADERSWKRPNRRKMVMDNEYWPGNTGYAAGTVVVTVDTSGSISNKELTSFLSEMAGILNDCTPEYLWALGVDARVHDSQLIEEIPDLEEFGRTLKGGGGTDMTVTFRWVDEQNMVPDACVILTDGYTPFGDDPGYPVIWVITSSKTAPFGKNIHLKLGH